MQTTRLSPLVSVITPFYNSEKYLSYAIQSVLNQTYANWELILIDDGSNDQSLSIAKDFRDNRIKILQRPNGGQCVASNDGLRVAQGDFIQFLDADDIMHPQKTQNQIRDLQINGCDALGISRWAFFYNDPSDADCREEPVFFSGDPVEWICTLWSNDTMMHTNSYMMSRQVLERGGMFFDESLKLNIDFEYFTRMALSASKIIYTPDSLGYYRKGVPGSKTFKPSVQKQLGALESRSKAIRTLLKFEDSVRTREAARMALSILTFTFPGILPLSRNCITELGLERFGYFKGKYFKYISNHIGFENAIVLRKIYQRYLS